MVFINLAETQSKSDMLLEAIYVSINSKSEIVTFLYKSSGTREKMMFNYFMLAFFKAVKEEYWLV